MLTLLLSSISKLKTVHLQGFCSKTVYLYKKCASSRFLAKNRVSQVFWDPIKNRVSPRSALLEAVYLEALLYFFCNYSLKLCEFDHFILQHKPTLISNLLTSIVANFQSGSRSFYSWYKVIDAKCSQEFYKVVFTFVEE